MAMFGLGRVSQNEFEVVVQRLNLVENVTGLLGPRVATQESMMRDVVKKLSDLETRSDRHRKRMQLLDEEQPVSITAVMAEGAPLFTEQKALPPVPDATQALKKAHTRESVWIPEAIPNETVAVRLTAPEGENPFALPPLQTSAHDK